MLVGDRPALTVTSDGQILIASYACGHGLAGFDARTGKEAWRRYEPSNQLGPLLFALPDPKRFVVSKAPGGVQIVDATTGATVTPEHFRYQAMLAAEFAEANRSLITAGSDSVIHVWSPASGQEVSQTKIEDFNDFQFLHGFGFSRDQRTLLAHASIAKSPYTSFLLFIDSATGKN